MMIRTPGLALPARGSATLGRGRARSAVTVNAMAKKSVTTSSISAASKVPAAEVQDSSSTANAAQLLAAFPVLGLLAMPEAAEAAVSPVASAFAAYGHYLGLVLVVASLTTEKLLIKANPSEEDAQKLVIADSVYGIAGRGVGCCTPLPARVSQLGYLRTWTILAVIN
jgi:hypothetical protein